jgi:hypothetical protein
VLGRVQRTERDGVRRVGGEHRQPCRVERTLRGVTTRWRRRRKRRCGLACGPHGSLVAHARDGRERGALDSRHVGVVVLLLLLLRVVVGVGVGVGVSVSVGDRRVVVVVEVDATTGERVREQHRQRLPLTRPNRVAARSAASLRVEQRRRELAHGDDARAVDSSERRVRRRAELACGVVEAD